MRQFVKTAAISAALSLTAVAVQAATVGTTFPVTATVQANCLVSATALAFGNYAPGSGNVDAASAVTVRCTSGTAYTVGLNQGLATGATVTTRSMVNGTNLLSYALFSNATRTTNWGNTAATNWVSGTGAGMGVPSAQTHNVYGRVADTGTNLTAPVGAYADTISVTVTY